MSTRTVTLFPYATLVRSVDVPPGAIVAHPLGWGADRGRDARPGRAAVALHHQPVEAEKHRAVMVVGIEPVAQQIGRGLRDQETYLRARRADRKSTRLNSSH